MKSISARPAGKFAQKSDRLPGPIGILAGTFAQHVPVCTVGLACVLMLVFATCGYAQGEAVADPDRGTYWAHVAVTLIGVVFAMRLAATAFARPPLRLADVLTGPEYLTSPEYYRFGMAVFVIVVSFIFLVLIYLHREVVAVVDLFKIPFVPEAYVKQMMEAVSKDTAPYLLIVVIIGALYLYLLHKEAEWNVLLMLRDVIHIWIAIPNRVGTIVEEISHSLSVPRASVRDVVSRGLGVSAEDFAKDRNTPERLWAELSYIQMWLETQREAGEVEFFNKDEFKLDEVLSEYDGMVATVGALRGNGPAAATLVPTIKSLRNRFARIAGCYLVHKYGLSERLDHQALAFGIPVAPRTDQNPLKYIAIYLLTVAMSVYVGVYVSAIFFDWHSGMPLLDAIASQDGDLVLHWVGYSAANYGLAITVILVIRFIGWASSTRAHVTYLSTYCWTALTAFLVGPVGLALTAKYAFPVARFADTGLLATIASELEWGIGPAIIAVFISYYMDRQTSSTLPDINQSHGSIAWRIVVSLLLALATVVMLLPPLLSLKAAVGAPWSAEKLRLVAVGTTFFISFSLAMAAQFALRKPNAQAIPGRSSVDLRTASTA
jgi:hypothetical protein